MSEDAREIAQRIVREVLDAHEADAARTGASGEPAPVDEIDLREAPAAVAPDAGAALLDDSTARLTARRIVAEVLASHAAAGGDTGDDLPVVAEGEAAGPASATPVLHPITGRPAVLPSLPDEPDVDPDTDVADDAAAIARRIVASVLNQRPSAPDDGPPPVPSHLRAPAPVAEPEPEIAEPEPEIAEAEPDIAQPEPEVAVATGPEPQPEPEPEPEPVVVHGSYRLPAPSTPAEEEPTAMQVAVPADPEPAPEATAVLRPDEPADPDATTRVPVATLERPVVDEVRLEPTLSLPSAEPPRRAGRWLVASILGAVALAVLLPLAVQALRTLVSLS